MKVLILCPTYNRPVLVRQALRSLKASTSRDWVLAYIDDASDAPEVANAVEDVFDESYSHQIHQYRVSPEEKQRMNWTSFAVYMNRAIREIEADLVMFLSDDDALLPDYIENVLKWFEEHPNNLYGFSHIIPFFYPEERPSEDLPKRTYFVNYPHEINPVNAVDSSQVVWRRSLQTEKGLFIQEHRQFDHDAGLWEDFMRAGIGLCPFMGFYGQYKGLHSFQLGKMKGNYAREREPIV